MAIDIVLRGAIDSVLRGMLLGEMCEMAKMVESREQTALLKTV